MLVSSGALSVSQQAYAGTSLFSFITLGTGSEIGYKEALKHDHNIGPRFKIGHFFMDGSIEVGINFDMRIKDDGNIGMGKIWKILTHNVTQMEVSSGEFDVDGFIFGSGGAHVCYYYPLIEDTLKVHAGVNVGYAAVGLGNGRGQYTAVDPDNPVNTAAGKKVSFGCEVGLSYHPVDYLSIDLESKYQHIGDIDLDMLRIGSPPKSFTSDGVLAGYWNALLGVTFYF